MNISSFKGLALSGGGVAEVSCAGALREWVKAGGKLSQFTHISGTSAGAIVASMLALGASIDFIKEKLYSTNFSTFVDTSIFSQIRDIYELYNRYGWNSGDGLETWLGDLIKELSGSRDTTFKQAYDSFGIHLIIVKTDMLYPECQMVAMDYLNNPNEMLRHAIMTSCRIPLFFQADFDSSGHVFVDGGVLLNYPLRVLYKYLNPEECMGISLRTDPGNLVLKPVDSYKNFITSMVNAWLRASTERHVQADDWKRTCSIHTTLSAIDFDADKARVEEAIKQGESAMIAFISSLGKPSLEDIIKEKDALLAKKDEQIETMLQTFRRLKAYGVTVDF